MQIRMQPICLVEQHHSRRRQDEATVGTLHPDEFLPNTSSKQGMDIWPHSGLEVVHTFLIGIAWTQLLRQTSGESDPVGNIDDTPWEVCGVSRTV